MRETTVGRVRSRLLVPLAVFALVLTSVACDPTGQTPPAPANPPKPGSVPSAPVVTAAAPSWAKYVSGAKVLAPNAGWCWWQSRRAVIAGDQLLVGSVPSAAGAGGTTRVTQVLGMDLTSGATRTDTVATNPYRDDDHNSPGLVVNPDGSVTTAFTGHGDTREVRLRTTATPGSGGWRPLPDLVAPLQQAPNRVTYANLVRSEGLLWSFTRRDQRTWASWSADDGQTWTSSWLLFEGNFVGDPTRPDLARHRPYVQFAANPVRGRIDFVTTIGHPASIKSSSLYSGYIKGFQVFRTDGTLVGPLSGPGYRPQDLTLVASPPDHPSDEPFADADLWGSDLIVDAGGDPVVTFSKRDPTQTQVPGRRFAHDYHWGRWDGTAWRVSRVGPAGSELYGGERDYTGLVTLDPTDPYRLVLSTNVDPRTGRTLTSTADGKAHWEIFEAQSTDGGATWRFRPITANSRVDNIRPLVAADGGRWAVVWLQGTYTSFTSWNLRAVVMSPALPLPAPGRPPAIDPTPPPPSRR